MLAVSLDSAIYDVSFWLLNKISPNALIYKNKFCDLYITIFIMKDYTLYFRPLKSYYLPLAVRPGTGDYKMPCVRACVRPFVTFLQKPFYLLKYYS